MKEPYLTLANFESKLNPCCYHPDAAKTYLNGRKKVYVRTIIFDKSLSIADRLRCFRTVELEDLIWETLGCTPYPVTAHKQEAVFQLVQEYWRNNK